MVCRAASRLGIDAGRDLLLAPQFEVEAHLFFQLALKPGAVEQHVESSSEFAGEAHVVLLRLSG
jgi:hypothetical protein